jgi:hypothetical protein
VILIRQALRSGCAAQISAFFFANNTERRLGPQRTRSSARRPRRRRRRGAQSFLLTLSKAVIASRNSQHLSLRYRIIQFAGASARFLSAIAPVLGIVDRSGRHLD